MEAARRAEAIRLLGISQTLLQNKDFTGSRDFAILSQETDPLLDGPDHILAVADVLLAADHRVGSRNLDWYAILQVDRRCDDVDLIRRQYRRLALLLHPDKNQLPWADSAFRLVAEAWTVLSSAPKKAAFDAEFGLQLGSFARVDLVPVDNQRAFGFQQFSRQEDNLPPQQQVSRQAAPSPAAQFRCQDNNLPPQLQVSRGAAPPPVAEAGNTSSGGGSVQTRVKHFWTTCPYCYNLYEYPKVYADCCMRCQNCERTFHAAEIKTLPPAVPGKDAYYCYWGFFPVGFSAGDSKELPPLHNEQQMVANGGDQFVPVLTVNGDSNENAKPKSITNSGPRKRGRPRKNPLP